MIKFLPLTCSVMYSSAIAGHFHWSSTDLGVAKRPPPAESGDQKVPVRLELQRVPTHRLESGQEPLGM